MKVLAFRKANKHEKELLCIFLGLEFYTSPKRATILRSKVTDILRKNLSHEEIGAIKVKETIDFTPTYTKIKNKLNKSKE